MIFNASAGLASPRKARRRRSNDRAGLQFRNQRISKM
jgi:hypothetical protein